MHISRSALLVGLLTTVTLAGCAAGAAASPSPAAPTDPPPTQVPGGRQSPDPGAIGGDGTLPGGPGLGQPDLVVPKPGTTINAHPVSVETLEAQIDGRRVVVFATWWSGIAPCHVLDTVAVKQDGNAFTISLTEGAGDADAMCIDIAQQHATAIDLGELPAGDYTVEAQDGEAPPISFSIS